MIIKLTILILTNKDQILYHLNKIWIWIPIGTNVNMVPHLLLDVFKRFYVVARGAHIMLGNMVNRFAERCKKNLTN